MSKDVPLLRTELPGPKGRALIEADERVTSPSYTRAYPLAVARGEGCVIEDLDGNRFLDFNAGIAVCATGHCHPRVVKAVQEQAGRLLHYSGTDFYYDGQAELSNKLAVIAPGDSPKRVYLANSGAESVEAAIKLARHHTGRSYVIAFRGAFHGRTMGALSLTCSKRVQRERFGPLLPGVIHVDYPACYRCPLRPSYDADTDCCWKTFEQLDRDVFGRLIAPEEVAAIVVEPIQGEGGYIIPPAGFLQRLRELCDRHGILLVADEVQSGMGRTGKMFACEHTGVAPDILCLAKGIASGMPLGAIVAKADVMTWPTGAHASTFGGNPVCCAAALATIALLEEELIANAAGLGTYLEHRLLELQQRHAIIGDVRGLGLMLGVELVRDRATKEPAKAERNEIVEACFRRGLLILGCGENALRLSPPLIVTKEQADTAVAILDDVLGERGT